MRTSSTILSMPLMLFTNDTLHPCVGPLLLEGCGEYCTIAARYTHTHTCLMVSENRHRLYTTEH